MGSIPTLTAGSAPFALSDLVSCLFTEAIEMCDLVQLADFAFICSYLLILTSLPTRFMARSLSDESRDKLFCREKQQNQVDISYT